MSLRAIFPLSFPPSLLWIFLLWLLILSLFHLSFQASSVQIYELFFFAPERNTLLSISLLPWDSLCVTILSPFTARPFFTCFQSNLNTEQTLAQMSPRRNRIGSKSEQARLFKWALEWLVLLHFDCKGTLQSSYVRATIKPERILYPIQRFNPSLVNTIPFRILVSP